MKKQFGRSMIEMLGVLAIIGVLSIGGIALYRRAVNNHHANTILDDVNRFAFVIIEKGNYPLDAVIPKGDFKESGIYTLKGHQAAGANQFSILVSNVPKGVCEPLVDKAHIEYKVGVVAAGGSVDDEIVYDTLHKDICNNDVNDVAFYFGDTSLVCNEPDGDGPCTTNADCCGDYFCWYQKDASICHIPESGKCKLVSTFNPETKTMSDGRTWTRSQDTMSWWSTQNWCLAQGLKPVSRADIGCGKVSSGTPCTKSDILDKIQEAWANHNWHWLEDYGNSCSAYLVKFKNREINTLKRTEDRGDYALCH